MKRIVVTVLFALLCTGFVKAQDVYFGPKVGGNLTNLTYSGDNDFFSNNQMKLSSHFGVFGEFVITDYFSVQPELLYSTKGSLFDIEGNDEFKSAYVFKYLSLPVVAKYYVTEEITIEAGPQVAYLLSAKNVETSEIYVTSSGNEAASIDIKDEIQPYDLGVTAGVGYLTKTGFYISARYNMGLLNTFKDDPVATLKNGAIQLSAGFSFR